MLIRSSIIILVIIMNAQDRAFARARGNEAARGLGPASLRIYIYIYIYI